MGDTPVSQLVCVQCGSHSAGYYAISLRGEAVCSTHPVQRNCTFCAIPTSDSSQWIRLGSDVWRCTTCSIGAVETMDLARRHMHRVRNDLEGLGFALRQRVQVEVVDFRTLQESMPSSETVFGITFHLVNERHQAAQALKVMVLKGLPGAWFGWVTVHEAMHAWMGENGIDPASPNHREGICELLAYEWARRRTTIFAQNLAANMLKSSVPVYGPGLREMVRFCETGGGPPDIPGSVMRKLSRLHSAT